MLNDEQAGIDCNHCGHKEIAKTEAEECSLQKKLKWSDGGDPFCPECGATVWFESYLNKQD